MGYHAQSAARGPQTWPARMLRTSSLPLLVALAACVPGVGSDVDPVPLDVMTFNIRYGTAEDGPDAWPLRRGLVMEVIQTHRPHVLGVQEALRFQLDDIHRAIGGYGEVGVGRDDGQEAGEYSAILYDTERLEVDDQGTFWLSDTPEVPGSVSWGNRITRIASWAHFRDLIDGDAFYLYNTHWDHRSQPSRDSSAVLLLRRIADRSAADPVIVTGDFNAGETNSAFRTLLKGDTNAPGAPDLLDTFREIHPNATNVGTHNGFVYGDDDGDKIDAVLISSDWDVLGASIVRTARDGRYPSDHYPVTARIVRREPEGKARPIPGAASWRSGATSSRTGRRAQHLSPGLP